MATIPGPLEGDAEDVSLALEVAQTQWARGDVDEALKWLRKAADAAFEVEDDKRGIELSKTAAELTTEGKEPRKKPKPTPPRLNAQMQSPPPAPRRTPPPPSGARRTPPPPPKAAGARRAPSSPVAEQALDTTGTRRAAKAGHASRRANRVGPEDAPPRRPPRGQHEAPAAPGVERVSDEWLTLPEDSLLDIEETNERAARPTPGRTAGENTASARVADSQQAAVQTAAQSPRKREEPRPSKPPPGDSKTIRAALAVPSTRAVRVAAGRAPNGSAVVRVLDAQGLRPGEHDAMLVALTGDGDLRDLFR